MNTGKLTKPLRALGLIHFTDKLKYHYSKFKYRKSNAEFKRTHPDVVLPPDYMMFEAYKLDYRNYYYDGRDYAKEQKKAFEEFAPLKDKRILDWGCGPCRSFRHYPEVIGNGCSFYGTDYNPDTISWCKENIPGIEFSKNGLNPPLVYESGFFNAVIGVSIFTHLGEENHRLWYEELMRVCAPGALLFLTTHGDAYKHIMTGDEIQRYDQGEIVTRANAVEGHRVFAAFHPPSTLHALFSEQSEVLKHTPGEKTEWGILQDVWMLRRR